MTFRTGTHIVQPAGFDKTQGARATVVAMARVGVPTLNGHWLAEWVEHLNTNNSMTDIHFHVFTFRS